MPIKYFKVTCKCGHGGRGKYIEKDFPVFATSRKQASLIARNIPRVKHHQKDAIISCVEISHEEFLMLMEKNAQDPYLQCKNIQEQRLIANLNFHSEAKAEIKKTKRELVKYNNKKRKIMEKSFLRYQYDYESWSLSY